MGAPSAIDAWAVGGYTTPNVMHTLVLHWNGAKWPLAARPNPRSDTDLQSVNASPAGTWAAGYVGRYGLDALVLHWNGKPWFGVANPASQDTVLLAMAVLFEATRQSGPSDRSDLAYE